MQQLSKSGTTPTLDSARSEVARLLSDAPTLARLRQSSEEQTRVVLIEGILRALGWDAQETEREVPSGSGDFLDYEIRFETDPWLVVEAKRVGKTFSLPKPTAKAGGRLRSISTLQAQGGKELRAVLKQAAGYCNDRGVPLACVTNGLEWVFFRGLSVKMRPWTRAAALAFSGAQDVLARFEDFYWALSRVGVGTSYLPELLDRPSNNIPAPTIPRDHLSIARTQPDPERIAVVRAVGEYLLSDIHGGERQGMLDRCYVTPGTSGDFERSIQRLLKDSEDQLDTDDGVVSGDPQRFVQEVSRHEQLSEMRQPIVVVGHVGAGKTTFLHKSLASLRADRSAFCAFVDLEGRGYGQQIDAAHEERVVAQLILERLRNAASTVVKVQGLSAGDKAHADPTSRETLRTLLRDELARERQLGEKLWSADETAWHRKEYEMLASLKDDPARLLPMYIGQLRARFTRQDQRKFPILLVLDNLDMASDEYQRCIYGFAQRLAKRTRAVVVVSIREDTYLSGRESDGFLSSSPLSFVFHVAAPALDRVLRQRVQFAQHAIEDGTLTKGIRQEPAAVTDTLDFLVRTLLADKSESLGLVAGLAGNDMRAALDIVRAFAEGGINPPRNADGTTEFLLECLVQSAGQDALLTRCRISNCFYAEPAPTPFHNLIPRLLAYFAWARGIRRGRALAESSEVAVGRFSAWGYPGALVRSGLRRLLRSGSLRSRNPTADLRDQDDMPTRISITASGYVHLTKLLNSRVYQVAMAVVSPWYDNYLVEKFIEHAEAGGGSSGTRLSDVLLSPAVAYLDAYRANMLGREDELLAHRLSGEAWLASVLSQVGGERQILLHDEEEEESEQFILAHTARYPAEELPTISRETKYKDTVEIPRILWALEWAKRTGRGPLSAAAIARILEEYGEIDVPPNNVARAFRTLKDDERARNLWVGTKKRYEITDAGTKALLAILMDMK